MSLYGVLRSGTSGMNAQSNRLGVVADNIQNQNTTGYKRGETEFSSLLIDSSTGNYNSGAVETKVLHAIDTDGTINYTTSATDLAIKGHGFFVVSDAGGTPTLTRAGSFKVEEPSGDLVNTAGFRLMGYKIADGEPALSLNSFNGLVPVNVKDLALKAVPSTKATLSGNLPDGAAPVAAGQQPPANKTFTKTNLFTAFDNVGNKVSISLYYAKTSPTTWEVTAYNADNPASFPGTPLGGPATLTFDGNGKQTADTALTFTIPRGQPFTLTMSGMTQLAAEFGTTAAPDGRAPSAVKDTSVGSDGTVYALYDDGTQAPVFRIPLATVGSPDQLMPKAGNVFETTIESGDPRLGFANQGGRGSITSKALEQSTVDIGTELTTMIEAQTAYTANSKVFQTGNEMLQTLMELKR